MAIRAAILLALLCVVLVACRAAVSQPGSEHALFATEIVGAFGGGDRPSDVAIWSLEAQAAQTCPRGYDKLGEQARIFAEGREWVWWIRCGAP